MPKPSTFFFFFYFTSHLPLFVLSKKLTSNPPGQADSEEESAISGCWQTQTLRLREVMRLLTLCSQPVTKLAFGLVHCPRCHLTVVAPRAVLPKEKTDFSFISLA